MMTLIRNHMNQMKLWKRDSALKIEIDLKSLLSADDANFDARIPAGWRIEWRIATDTNDDSDWQQKETFKRPGIMDDSNGCDQNEKSVEIIRCASTWLLKNLKRLKSFQL